MKLHLRQTRLSENASQTSSPSVIGMLMRLHYDHGEQRLMLAILLDALNTIACHKTRHGAKNWGDCQTAVQWVRAQDRRWLFSFENICSALDLNPIKLRAALVAEFPALFFKTIRASTFHPTASVSLQPVRESLLSQQFSQTVLTAAQPTPPPSHSDQA
jgi:hypothetical protein